MLTDYLDKYLEPVDQLKQLKPRLLGHCRAPIKVASDQIWQLLVAVVNLAYGSPASCEDLLNPDNAKAALTDKVIGKTIKGIFVWAALASHMGTHHPKSRNDKASSGPVVARDLTPPPAGLVTSANLNTRQFSGSGNGANTAHYQLLAFTYEDHLGVLSVIERAAGQDEALRTALMALGISPAQWEAFQTAAATHLSTSSLAALDRQLKQIFVPDPTQGGETYLVITPLSATRVISALEQQRVELGKQNASLNFARIGIGGAKPKNAGSLINELGGSLRQLTMPMPRLTLTQQHRRLWHFRRGRLFQPMPNKEAQQFQHWLNLDWTQQYGSRQDHLQQLEQRLAEWLLPELEEQDQFLDWLISDAPDAVKARQQLEPRNLPNWILTLAKVSKSPGAWRSVYESRKKASCGALVFHLKSPLGDEIDKLVWDALEKLFARCYPDEEIAA